MSEGNTVFSQLESMLKDQQKIIIIIDDDPDVVKLVHSFLESDVKGVKLIHARNGETGIIKVTEQVPNLVILDINMPGLSGIDVLKKIRADNKPEIKSIPVLMLTIKNEQSTVKNAVMTGANDYMIKPFKRSDLVKKVKNLLQID